MSHFTTSDGLSIYFEDTGGDGLPVLCLAGLTRTSRDFDYVAPHLNNVRLIRMDYRGRGQSAHAQDWSSYSIPVECRDVFELLAHLSLEKTAVIGTSRGGLIAMGLAATAPDTILGVALNDVGPEVGAAGLDAIKGYLGRNPSAKTYEDAALATEQAMTGFSNVPKSRWLQEVRTHYRETEDGLEITYDPKLRDAVLEAMKAEPVDLWPYFAALADKPLALIWGVNSNLLTSATVAKMQNERPDMILAKVPDRGHIPFLDEPEALEALHTWLDRLR